MERKTALARVLRRGLGDPGVGPDGREESLCKDPVGRAFQAVGEPLLSWGMTGPV